MPLFHLYFSYFLSHSYGYAPQNELHLNEKLTIFNSKNKFPTSSKIRTLISDSRRRSDNEVPLAVEDGLAFKMIFTNLSRFKYI